MNAAGGWGMAFEDGRRAAALEVVRGFERALAALESGDHAERRWYQERLRDARIIAGLPSLWAVA